MEESEDEESDEYDSDDSNQMEGWFERRSVYREKRNGTAVLRRLKNKLTHPPYNSFIIISVSLHSLYFWWRNSCWHSIVGLIQSSTPRYFTINRNKVFDTYLFEWHHPITFFRVPCYSSSKNTMQIIEDIHDDGDDIQGPSSKKLKIDSQVIYRYRRNGMIQKLEIRFLWKVHFIEGEYKIDTLDINDPCVYTFTSRWSSHMKIKEST